MYGYLFLICEIETILGFLEFIEKEHKYKLYIFEEEATVFNRENHKSMVILKYCSGLAFIPETPRLILRYLDDVHQSIFQKVFEGEMLIRS